jgi:modulator of FtsH protease HflC
VTPAQRFVRTPIAWAIIAIAVALAVASTFAVVPETKQALIVRLGQPSRIVNAYKPGVPFGRTGAGMVARIPFLEQVVWIDKRVLSFDMDRQSVLSTDQLRLEVDAFARYRIVDPLRAYVVARGDERRVSEALRPILGSELRNELGKRPFAALLSPERGRIMLDIKEGLNRIAHQYGAEIVDVRIKRADLPDGTPLDSAYNRMRTARTQEALTIQAQGLKRAQIIRAEADAQAAKVYADAFGQDPDFYDFYRSMQSYRHSFGVDGTQGDGSTTMVLSGNDQYLRQFNGGGHAERR